MKFLHCSDLHLGKTLENNSRLDEQREVLQEIVEICAEENIDLVLISGDIYDAFIPPAAAEVLFYDFVLKLSENSRRKIVLIAGNHDQPERLAAAKELASNQGIYIVSKPTLLSFELKNGEQVKIAALPYLSEARFGEAFLTEIQDEHTAADDYQQQLKTCFELISLGFSPKSANIVMAHLFVNGGKVSESERPLAIPMQVGGSFGVSTDVFPAADYIALGHLHRPQQVKSSVPCYYSGSPLAYSFSEANQQKIVIVAEIAMLGEEKKCNLQEIPLRSGLPLSRHMALSYDEALNWCLDERNHHCWLELQIRVESGILSAPEIDSLRKAHPHLSAIRPIYPIFDEEQKRQQRAEELDISERFRLFAAMREGVECDDELLQAFKELISYEEVSEEI